MLIVSVARVCTPTAARLRMLLGLLLLGLLELRAPLGLLVLGLLDLRMLLGLLLLGLLELRAPLGLLLLGLLKLRMLLGLLLLGLLVLGLLVLGLLVLLGLLLLGLLLLGLLVWPRLSRRLRSAGTTVLVVATGIRLVGKGVGRCQSSEQQDQAKPSQQRATRRGAVEIVHRSLLEGMLSDAAPAVQIEARPKRVVATASTAAENLPIGMSVESSERTRPALTHALFDSMRSLACITGYMGQYLAANAAFTAALGWTEQELRGFAYFDLAPPSERQSMMKVGADIIRNGGGEPSVYKRPMRHKDGSYRLIEWTVWADPPSRLVYGLGRVLGDAEVTSTAG
jgi:PAS domain S-box-containing protein